MKVLDIARPGAVFLLNSPYPADETWAHLPVEVQQQILDKGLRCHVIDAHRVAREVGLGGRINTVMQPCFFALSGVLPAEEATAALKEAIAEAYGKRGPAVVERNQAAIDRALDALTPLPVPEFVHSGHRRMPPLPDAAPDFVKRVTERLLAGDGDLLPVSALPVDGTFPTGTARWEKRALAQEIPIWDPSICIDCGKCAIVCPHATIRLKVYDPAVLAEAPEGFQSKDYGARDLRGLKLTVQVAPDDCTGCGVCVDMCPAFSKSEVRHLLGLRRDAVPEAAHPAVRRPAGRRERHRLLVHLRRQPAHHALGSQRRRARPSLVQLAVRGQRRVRARAAAGL